MLFNKEDMMVFFLTIDHYRRFAAKVRREDVGLATWDEFPEIANLADHDIEAERYVL